jgi:hypothetical protein
MAVDITKLLEELQKKISSADSNSSENDLYYMIKAVSRGDGTSLSVYDSAGELPSSPGPSSSKKTLGWVNSNSFLHKKESTWKELSTYPSFRLQGTNKGYSAGGYNQVPYTYFGPPYPAPQLPIKYITNHIESFSFASGSYSNIRTELFSSGPQRSSHSSETHGYSVDDFSGVTSKFAFTAETGVGAVPDISSFVGPSPSPANSFGNFAAGYTVTGSGASHAINKFPYAAEDGVSSIGSLSDTSRGAFTGVSSLDHGYLVGGVDPSGPTNYDTISRFSFYSSGNDTDVGDLSYGNYFPSKQGVSSTENGYVMQWTLSGNPLSYIEKFPFSSSVSTTNFSPYGTARYGAEGLQSTTTGYFSGGELTRLTPPGNDAVNNSLIFPFASDTQSTSVPFDNTTRSFPTSVGQGRSSHSAWQN